jgi:hypothetical protein
MEFLGFNIVIETYDNRMLIPLPVFKRNIMIFKPSVIFFRLIRFKAYTTPFQGKLVPLGVTLRKDISIRA